MINFEDVKMMFDWGCCTEDQVREIVPICITDEEANKIVGTAE
ncbi:XkdX family protein [Enterococcus avium]